MKRLKGFTLAEALITLAIIGVIASMVLPNLATDVQKQQVGPALAKAVNTLENANKMILQQNNARKLSSICEDDYVSCLNDYINGTLSTPTDTYYAYDLKTTLTKEANMLVGKDSIAYFLESAGLTSIETPPANSKYHNRYYTLLIDINGPKKRPNVLGKDTFKFYVDDNGSVIPYGGSEYKSYMAGEAVLWETECLKSGPTNGASCTGSIADKSWKVDY